MQFRLIYKGPLKSNNSTGIAKHKHGIRCDIHKQLYNLWHGEPRLAIRVDSEESSLRPPIYEKYGFSFCPLVDEGQHNICGLDILLLRPRMAGSLVSNGDIDNKIKTLIDALRMPQSEEEVKQFKPERGEAPFYCLLKDDSLINRLSVSADVLLDEDLPGNFTGNQKKNFVMAIITATIKPTMGSLTAIEWI